MNFDTTFQLGLDLAAAGSIIYAVVTYGKTQYKARKQAESQFAENKTRAEYQFAENNLWRLLDFIRASSRGYIDITDDLRVIATQHKGDAGVAMASEAGNGIVMKLLFLTERIKMELQSQQEIYLPLFFNTEKELLKDSIAKFDDILEELRSTNAKQRLAAILQINKTILEVEKDIVKKLYDILPKFNK